MKKPIFLTRLGICLGFCLSTTALLFGQGGPLDPADLLKPLTENWTSYSGDYTGRRYSFLKQITAENVKGLSMEWFNTGITSACGPDGTQAQAAAGGGGRGGGRGGGGGGSAAASLIVGGFGDGVTGPNTCAPARFQGGVLVVKGVIYASQPGNVYAIDARTGQLLWHNYWKIRPGHGLGNRGLAMWNNRIYFGEQDDWLVCLDASTGKEVWKKEVASLDENYWISSAPMVVGNHVLIGASNNLDMPASLKAYDPETGNGSNGSWMQQRRSLAIRAKIRGSASTKRVTAAAPRGFRALTIRNCIFTTTAPATPRPLTRRDAATETTSTRDV